MLRKQHVGRCTAESVFKARLCKTGVRVPRLLECVCVSVACLLTFAAQQSISRMHMQTIKVMRGGCVCTAAASSQKDLLAHGRTSVSPRGGGRGGGLRGGGGARVTFQRTGHPTVSERKIMRPQEATKWLSAGFPT